MVYYLHGDHLGSTSLTTDDTGAIVSEVRYLPYGQERWSNGSSPTDFGFTSQRAERSFGLMDYNARYYSAVLGRFVSPDSIVPEPGSSGGFNRYRYTRNNPLRYTDPSGFFEDDEIIDSLYKQYEDEEVVEHIWKLWQEDTAFLEMLREADFGDDVWASDMFTNGEHVGPGSFRKEADGRITISFNKSNEIKDLYQLQGQGAYQLQKQTGELWNSNDVVGNTSFQPVYGYNSAGIPYGQVGTKQIMWTKEFLGLPGTDSMLKWMAGYQRSKPIYKAAPSLIENIGGLLPWIGEFLTLDALNEPWVYTLYEPNRVMFVDPRYIENPKY